MNPKLLLEGRIYMFTVGSVLTANVSQTNLCQLLFRTTLKVRLDSSLSKLLEWTTLSAKKFTACLREGLIHELKQLGITSPNFPPYVAKQLTALFHTQPPFGSLG